MADSTLHQNKTLRQDTLDRPFVYKSMAEVEHSQPSRQEQAHRHDYFTIIYVENAQGLHHIDFREYPLQPHTIHFISPEQVHHVELGASTPQGHVLLCSIDFLQQYSLPPADLLDRKLFFNCDEVAPIQVTEGYIDPLSIILSQIKEEYRNASSHYLEMIGALLTRFFVICQRIKEEHHIIQAPRANRKADIVRQFKKDLEQHYRHVHKVAEYAGFQHLSSVYLNEVLKGETGTSAKDFIQNRIILEAKRKALFTTQSMKEIAWELGFEDTAHFSKFFKKCQGVSFSDFRSGKKEPIK